MKKILLILISSLTVSLFSQTIRVTYEPGFGIYSQDKLKDLQITMSKQLNGLPVKTVVQFPDYINHSASIGFYMDKNNIFGFNATYLTTGGRNHIRDYSGEYKLDMILNGYQFGIESEHIFNLNNKLDINANFKLGIVLSNLEVSEYLIIYDLDSNTTSSRYIQGNFFLEPNLNLSYKIIHGIALNVGVGINLNTSVFNGQLIDWSGFRFRTGLSYSF
ncbi:MAG: hypothetical protein Q7U47_14265 [Paludibacter sp.]|nr:hypothetical protein [Paludibacter sp.]